MDRKETWNASFEIYLAELDGKRMIHTSSDRSRANDFQSAKKPVVWGGDINVVRDDKGDSGFHSSLLSSPRN
jgi:hypothetical protein